MWWEDRTFVLDVISLSRDWDGTSSIKCSGEWFFSLFQPLDTGQDAVVSSSLMLGILELLALICRSADARTWNQRQLPLNVKYLTIYSSFVNNTSGLRHRFPWQRVSVFPASSLHLQPQVWCSSVLYGYSTSQVVHFHSLLNGAGSSNMGNKHLNLGPPTLPSVKCWIEVQNEDSTAWWSWNLKYTTVCGTVEHSSEGSPELSCESVVCVSLSKTFQLKW